MCSRPEFGPTILSLRGLRSRISKRAPNYYKFHSNRKPCSHSKYNFYHSTNRIFSRTGKCQAQSVATIKCKAATNIKCCPPSHILFPLTDIDTIPFHPIPFSNMLHRMFSFSATEIRYFILAPRVLNYIV